MSFGYLIRPMANEIATYVNNNTTRKPGRPRATMKGLQERLQRYRIAERCAELAPEAIAFWHRIATDKRVPLRWRFEAWDRLMDRGFGRAPVAIALDATTREASLKKIVHEVRWLPCDPNDRSVVIEPEPD